MRRAHDSFISLSSSDLPRLIPAPQALIGPNHRVFPKRDKCQCHMCLQWGYAANQLFPIANMEPFSVRVLRIRYNRRHKNGAEAGTTFKPTITLGPRILNGTWSGFA
jgi:hypothetical protein